MPDTPDELRRSVAMACERATHDMDRFLAEVAFAEGLCELNPRRAPAWRKLIARAVETVRGAAPGTDLKAKMMQAEGIMAPIGVAAKELTLHLVGHGHIDMNWMWSWPETVAVTNDTFTTVLRLMDEYPEFTFSQSQASVYAILQRHNPALLQRIAQRVKEGRWEVIASQWVEGDKNLAGGESLCRHLLYTRRYMRELFGLEPEDVQIDWSPDTFGHAITVPSVLARGAVRYYYLHRPGTFTRPQPRAFWWQAPDGSRVLVKNDVGIGYNGQITPAMTRLLLDFVRETGGRHAMFVYGVGDHGGGPTRRDILAALEMANWPIFPAIRFSTTRAFYQALEKEGAKLPVIKTELNTEFTGCFTSQSLIKKANRFAECRLVDAELTAALVRAACSAGVSPACSAGVPPACGAGFQPAQYPADLFTEGWRDTLFNHFHDILPGSGVHDTRTYTHGLYQKTMAATSQAETQSLRALAARVDTCALRTLPADMPAPFRSNALGAGVGFHSADGSLSAAEGSIGEPDRPYLLFNPTAWTRREVVEATLWDNSIAPVLKPLKDRAFAAAAPDGTRVAAQVVADGKYWGHQYVTLAFPAQVDGLGYALYTLSENGVPLPPPATAGQIGFVHHCAYVHAERDQEGLENDLVRIELDMTTGGIRSLLDKRSGVQIIGDRPAGLEYGVERPRGMTSWCVAHTGGRELPRVTGIRRTLRGPHKAALAVTYKLHESDITLTYELRAGDPRLYVHLSAVWFQRGTKEDGVPVLDFALPLALDGARARYEVPFGAIDRPQNKHEEVPALQWAQVSGKQGKAAAGCLLANDSKHGHSLDGNTLRLTLIRSSIDPDILPEIGQHEVHLSVMPFSDALTVAEATRHARDLNHPLRVVGTDVHTGDLPAAAQFLRIEPESVLVSTVKKAEDSDALLIRLYETAGRRVTARVHLDAALLGKPGKAVEVDMMERPLSPSHARTSGGTVSVPIDAHGIGSVIVPLKRG